MTPHRLFVISATALLLLARPGLVLAAPLCPGTSLQFYGMNYTFLKGGQYFYGNITQLVDGDPIGMKGQPNVTEPDLVHTFPGLSDASSLCTRMFLYFRLQECRVLTAARGSDEADPLVEVATRVFNDFSETLALKETDRRFAFVQRVQVVAQGGLVAAPQNGTDAPNATVMPTIPPNTTAAPPNTTSAAPETFTFTPDTTTVAPDTTTVAPQSTTTDAPATTTDAPPTTSAPYTLPPFFTIPLYPTAPPATPSPPRTRRPRGGDDDDRRRQAPRPPPTTPVPRSTAAAVGPCYLMVFVDSDPYAFGPAIFSAQQIINANWRFPNLIEYVFTGETQQSLEYLGAKMYTSLPAVVPPVRSASSPRASTSIVALCGVGALLLSFAFYT